MDVDAGEPPAPAPLSPRLYEGIGPWDEPLSRPSTANLASYRDYGDHVLEGHVTDSMAWKSSGSYSRTLLRSAGRIRTQTPNGRLMRQMGIASSNTHAGPNPKEKHQERQRAASAEIASHPRVTPTATAAGVAMAGAPADSELAPPREPPPHGCVAVGHVDHGYAPLSGTVAVGHTHQTPIPGREGGTFGGRAALKPIGAYEGAAAVAGPSPGGSPPIPGHYSGGASPTSLASRCGSVAATPMPSRARTPPANLLSTNHPYAWSAACTHPWTGEDLSPPSLRGGDRRRELAARYGLAAKPPRAMPTGATPNAPNEVAGEDGRPTTAGLDVTRPTASSFAAAARPGTSPARPLLMTYSKSASALPAKLVDFLPPDVMPMRPKSGYHSPTSRQSNHSAFSPQGSGGFSPGLLPLRRARSAGKLSQLAAGQRVGRAPVKVASPREPPKLQQLYTRDSLLHHWAMLYTDD